jgi:hypothetical protein
MVGAFAVASMNMANAFFEMCGQIDREGDWQ